MKQPDPWSSLKEAAPRLAPHVSIHPRTIRGEPWAVLRNAVNGENVRLNGPALAVVLAFDGKQTVEQLTIAAERFSDPAVDTTSDGTANVAARDALAVCLLTLEQSGMLRLGRTSDSDRLVERAHRDVASRSWLRRLDPLALRVPLVDPDTWLERCGGVLDKIPGRVLTMGLTGLALLSLGVAIAQSDEIAIELSQLTASPSRWWLYALVYPILKLCHEIAHALVVKRYGGAVHEAGVTILVLMPVPYVDASDSSHFTKRAQRLAVVAAGMLAEAALAGLGVLIWSVTEIGLLHEIAFSVALLGLVSTFVFNANPLLRFDGYHLLQDAIDVPNLGSRATHYLKYLLRRILLRAQIVRPPFIGPRERRWLLGYGVASLVYRVGLTLGIAAYLLDAIPLAGVALAAFAIYRLFGRPVFKAVRYLLESDEIAAHRRRATGACAGMAALLLVAIAWLPMPASTRAEGVVRAAGQSVLHSTASGRIAEWLVPAGQAVSQGEPILRLDAPELQARRRVLETEIVVLETRRQAVLRSDPADARRLASDVARAEAERAELARDDDELIVRAASDGRFAPEGRGLPVGQTVERGQVIGHVINRLRPHIEVVITQQQIGRVRGGLTGARVRLAERPGQSVVAALISHTPKADHRLPSAVLAHDGSRGIAVASGNAGLRTLEPIFHLELALPDEITTTGIGGRAFVTLLHEPESLGRRWWRATRQLFLEKLSV